MEPNRAQNYKSHLVEHHLLELASRENYDSQHSVSSTQTRQPIQKAILVNGSESCQEVQDN